MKNKTLKHIINLILISVFLTSFLYLNFAFCANTFDATKWNQDLRITLSLVNTASIITVVVVYCIIEDLIK
jgi:hypothetical protein